MRDLLWLQMKIAFVDNGVSELDTIQSPEESHERFQSEAMARLIHCKV